MKCDGKSVEEAIAHVRREIHDHWKPGQHLEVAFSCGPECYSMRALYEIQQTFRLEGWKADYRQDTVEGCVLVLK